MPRNPFCPKGLISKLRQAEGLLAHGKTTAEVCRGLNVTEQTCYRWPPEGAGAGECPAQEAVSGSFVKQTILQQTLRANSQVQTGISRA